MAIFVTVHKKLNFFDMQFVNGRYETNDPKQIRILSSVEAKRNNVVRLDPPQPKPEAVKEEVIDSPDDKVSEKPKYLPNGKPASSGKKK